MTGSLHIGLAALGAAIGVGLIGMGASTAVGRNPGPRRRSWSSRFWPLPLPKRSCSTRCSWSVAGTARRGAARSKRVGHHACSRPPGGRRERRTDRRGRPHVRRRLAAPRRADRQLRHRVRGPVPARYKPILRILEARRQQIAAGLANAEKIKAELARIEAERLDVLAKADAEGKRLIEEARAAAARVHERGDAQGDRRRRTDPVARAREPRARTARACSPSSSARSAASSCRRPRR